MIRMPRARVAVIGAALVLGMILVQTPAQAAIDMVSGSRGVAASAPVSDCSTKAKAALTTALQAPFEAGDGTGQWIAFGVADADGHSSSAATVHCFPVGKGYSVTLACAVEHPADTESAAQLCARIEKAFGTDQTGGITWQ